LGGFTVKKTVSILMALILFLGILPAANFAQAAAPGTYNPGDIAVIKFSAQPQRTEHIN